VVFQNSIILFIYFYFLHRLSAVYSNLYNIIKLLYLMVPFYVEPMVI